MTGLVVDLFCGAGGWLAGAQQLGLDPIGIELDPWAARTHQAAGGRTIRADVATYPLGHLTGRVTGLIASPPCQSFSRAGKRGGLTDSRGQLVHEVMRWATALRPEWIACEQVPDVLPIWRYFACQLRELGYSAWAGVLNSADYGVPQTRQRAILMASRSSLVTPPAPTHAEHPSVSFDGTELEPWITMAAALGWGLTKRPSLTVASASAGGGHGLDGGSGARRAYHKAMGTPGHWAWRRPATTLTADPRVFQPGGHHAPGEQSRNALQVTPQEAATLQSFSPDYPWQGTETEQHRQIGNAIPPLLACRILGALTAAAEKVAA